METMQKLIWQWKALTTKTLVKCKRDRGKENWHLNTYKVGLGHVKHVRLSWFSGWPRLWRWLFRSLIKKRWPILQSGKLIKACPGCYGVCLSPSEWVKKRFSCWKLGLCPCSQIFMVQPRSIRPSLTLHVSTLLQNLLLSTTLANFPSEGVGNAGRRLTHHGGEELQHFRKPAVMLLNPKSLPCGCSSNLIRSEMLYNSLKLKMWIQREKHTHAEYKALRQNEGSIKPQDTQEQIWTVVFIV